MTYCLVFVCQQGELEIKTLLLAASLRKHLRCEHELIAALPQPAHIWGTPSDNTLSLLGEMGVRIVAIENPIGPDYPIGNKLACLDVETSAEKVVFLDSDMLCLRDFEDQARFFGSEVNAKPADLATGAAANLSRWERAYAALGLEMPTTRMHATVSGEVMPPYFNAGFIAVRTGSGLGTEWAACARALDADPLVPDKRPWLDQLALPIALARLELEVDCLDERYNFPAHLKPLDPANLPWFCHYHWPEVLRREPVANAAILESASRYPTLRKLLEEHRAWAALLRPYVFAPAPQPPSSVHVSGSMPASSTSSPPELIVTGIPRSGTSFLCKLIQNVDNCVVINEPREIFAPLAEQQVPWGVALHYRELRRDILDGRPIANKLSRGEFIEDTAVVDTVESYSPTVHRADFLLGTKNTLAYLARLPHLREALPGAGIVACVRHPLDTIASWKATFAHLASADLETQILGHSRDPLLGEAQRARLRKIALTADLPRRRAMLWNHLAKILLENSETLVVLRYEDILADPDAVLRKVFEAIPQMFNVPQNGSIERSSPRSRRDALDAQDLKAIRSICGSTAAELGYALD